MIAIPLLIVMDTANLYTEAKLEDRSLIVLSVFRLFDSIVVECQMAGSDVIQGASKEYARSVVRKLFVVPW